ncbi:hypothetical protein ACFFF5_14550 [Lederbergia wuyishanensis]|uniref:LAS superfamily LD-carboxypeptidase LdcB n=1 Tax=Lederbergia wuyishanensis TaxID=1347903 RepID=A0ABU0D9W1_9BACI|nr:hypothetical protein [Lederbergia wuyishanensis]MCJ8007414.1 hypothetical protein [Lederbergia wuyishanensis]MDQ0345148.1 LAS superfamily LD-carboxypeptidase LdcB [Lederbergia wuyishanensis]
MNRLLIILLSVILLTACTSKKEKAQEANNINENKVEVTQTSEPEDNQKDNTKNTEGPEKKSDETTVESVGNEDYAELAAVFKKIGSDEYEKVIETDNPNKRVIFLEDQNHNKKFKSIYIKHENRLKLIDLENDQLIINEVL